MAVADKLNGFDQFPAEFKLMVKAFKLNPYWVEAFPLARWLKACETPAWGIQDDALREILPELYLLFPQPGVPAHDEMPVIIKKGGEIAMHAHPEWTLLYYVNLGDPVCAVMIDLGDEVCRVEPERGTAIMLAPNVQHAVEKSESVEPRLSIALRWKMAPDDE